MSKRRNVPIIILLCVKNPVMGASCVYIFQLIGYQVYMFSVELLLAIGF